MPRRNRVPESVSMETPKARKAEERRRREIEDRRRAEDRPSVSAWTPEAEVQPRLTREQYRELMSRGGQGDPDAMFARMDPLAIAAKMSSVPAMLATTAIDVGSALISGESSKVKDMAVPLAAGLVLHRILPGSRTAPDTMEFLRYDSANPEAVPQVIAVPMTRSAIGKLSPTRAGVLDRLAALFTKDPHTVVDLLKDSPEKTELLKWYPRNTKLNLEDTRSGFLGATDVIPESPESSRPVPRVGIAKGFRDQVRLDDGYVVEPLDVVAHEAGAHVPQIVSRAYGGGSPNTVWMQANAGLFRSQTAIRRPARIDTENAARYYEIARTVRERYPEQVQHYSPLSLFAEKEATSPLGIARQLLDEEVRTTAYRNIAGEIHAFELDRRSADPSLRAQPIQPLPSDALRFREAGLPEPESGPVHEDAKGGDARADAKGGEGEEDRFATSRNFLATDKVPDSIFGFPIVSREEDYTQEDIAFFRDHPEAGGYYDLGEGGEGEQGAEAAGDTGAPAQPRREPKPANEPKPVTDVMDAIDRPKLTETDAVAALYQVPGDVAAKMRKSVAYARLEHVADPVEREKLRKQFDEGKIGLESITVAKGPALEENAAAPTVDPGEIKPARKELNKSGHKGEFRIVGAATSKPGVGHVQEISRMVDQASRNPGEWPDLYSPRKAAEYDKSKRSAAYPGTSTAVVHMRNDAREELVHLLDRARDPRGGDQAADQAAANHPTASHAVRYYALGDRDERIDAMARLKQATVQAFPDLLDKGTGKVADFTSKLQDIINDEDKRRKLAGMIGDGKFGSGVAEVLTSFVQLTNKLMGPDGDGVTLTDEEQELLRDMQSDDVWDQLAKNSAGRTENMA